MNARPTNNTASIRSIGRTARRILFVTATVVGVTLGSTAVAQATDDGTTFGHCYRNRGAGSMLDCCLVVNGTVKVDKAGRVVGCRLDGQNGTIKV
ncbi:hypothetical protein [Mycobacterium sp. URHB0044]|uniref:hypothetical protein n=1 Tax=Mycobacterium sp. URHB0044 TaxID=1380386 RepID=UPI00048E7612|nr:hypothetical protein [Mycobacterium sp. URHB0044]